MGLFRPDFLLFACLFVLFGIVIAINRITLTHKVYLAFHFVMMLWPLGQFAVSTTDLPQYQALFSQMSFAAVGLLGPGWLFFVLFLTQRSSLLTPARAALSMIPSVLCIAAIVWNPQHWFFRPIDGQYAERGYGPLFWLLALIQLGYFFATLIFMFQTLKNDSSVNKRKQIAAALIGMFVLTGFAVLDILVNVLLRDSLPVIPGLMSLGLLLADCCFILAVYRYGMFDILTMAQQDIVNHMAIGIVVIDEEGKVLESNRGARPFVSTAKGGIFSMEAFLAPVEAQEEVREFLYRYRHHPEERMRTDVSLADERYVSVEISPVLDETKSALGRVIMLHDVSEQRKLVDEMNRKNEALHERNLELITIQEELFRVNQKLEQMAITDSLTGCYNRRFLMQQLEHEVLLNLRYRIPFSIFLFDIDHFKQINDIHGHLVGDEVIRRTADAVRTSLRRTDILARYGGEEFTVYLPHTNQEQAGMLAERIMQSVMENRVEAGREKVGITISMGIVSVDTFDQQVVEVKEYLRSLFSRADSALYKAKNEGRNRVIVAQTS
ncbi:diguanylate cyclase [Cohnella zeiphila]|uniref:histidine kinase N-terminal 7TM domain-containing diguanylate cyclase n=1 Tax=Cohnella zeiphila TaxID=2761120 RepID=UPI001EE19307|nr:diguanylate cyclase [Cohnella zeiphila]